MLVLQSVWRACVVLLLLGAGGGLAVLAGGTLSFELADFRGVADLDVQGVAVSVDGGLVPAPARSALVGPGVPVLWAVAPGPDNGAWAAGGAPGTLLFLPRRGQGRQVLEVPEAELTALVARRTGGVVVGVSPGGRVLAIGEDGGTTELLRTGSRYVWDLLEDDSGAVWVAAGDPGALWRIVAGGAPQKLLDLGAEQVRSLAPAAGDGVVFGTSGSGIIQQVAEDGRVQTLLDAEHVEVADLARAADGSLLAALVSPGGPPAPPPPAAAPAPLAAAGPQPAAPPGRPAAPATGGRSEVVHIAADGAVTMLWESTEETALSLLHRADGSVWVGSSPEGGIDRVVAPGRWSRWVTLPARSVTALQPLADGSILAATGGLGSVTVIAPQRPMEGVAVSPVHDAGQGARFGAPRWWARSGTGEGIALAFRSGMTARPDATWSPWSEWRTNAAAERPAAPPGRYVQWRARLRPAGGGGTPELARVQIPYLPPNRPPRLRKVEVLPPGVVLEPLPVPPGQGAPPAGSPAAAALTGDAPGGAAPRLRVRRTWISGRRTVSWDADDEDGDEVVARLWVRADGDLDFAPFARDITTPFHVFDEALLADGGFVFRIEVSDAPANTPERARSILAETERFLVDRTPPVINDLSWRAESGSWVLSFTVLDALTPPRAVQVSVDAGPFMGALPVDGVEDSKRERYRVSLPAGAPGQHIAVVQARDAAGNVVAARLRFEAQE